MVDDAAGSRPPMGGQRPDARPDDDGDEAEPSCGSESRPRPIAACGRDEQAPARERSDEYSARCVQTQRP